MTEKYTDIDIVVKQASYKSVSPTVNPLTRTNSWLKWGQNDAFPLELIDLTFSAIHNSCLQFKGQNVTGNGVVIKDYQRDFYLNVFDAQVDEFLTAISKDIVTYYGFAVKIYWNKDFSKIAKMKRVPFKDVRVENPSDPNLEPSNYYICKDWKNYTRYGVEKVPTFDPSKAGIEEPVQLYYFYFESEVYRYYPLPEYYKSVEYIKSDIAISEFLRSQCETGFSADIVIRHANNPSDEVKQKIIKNTDKWFSGSGGKKIMHIFGELTPDGNSQSVEIDILQDSGKVDKYNAIFDKVQQQILSTHQITSKNLLGFDTAAGFSASGAQLSTAWDVFNNVVLEKYRRPIRNLLKIALNINGVYLGEDIDFIIIQPTQNKFSESILSNILTKDELRAEIGYQPIEEETALAEENNTTQNGN